MPPATSPGASSAVRLHVWDKWTGDIRFEQGDLTVLMNIHSKEGRAFCRRCGDQRSRHPGGQARSRLPSLDQRLLLAGHALQAEGHRRHPALPRNGSHRGRPAGRSAGTHLPEMLASPHRTSTPSGSIRSRGWSPNGPSTVRPPTPDPASPAPGPTGSATDRSCFRTAAASAGTPMWPSSMSCRGRSSRVRRPWSCPRPDSVNPRGLEDGEVVEIDDGAEVIVHWNQGIGCS